MCRGLGGWGVEGGELAGGPLRPGHLRAGGGGLRRARLGHDLGGRWGMVRGLSMADWISVVRLQVEVVGRRRERRASDDDCTKVRGPWGVAIVIVGNRGQ